MPRQSTESSFSMDRPFTSRGVLAMFGLAMGALFVLALLGFYAVVMIDPPECFMRFGDDPHCARAMEEWTRLPAAFVGALAVLPLIAFFTALVKHRSTTVRWVTLGLIVVCPALALLIPFP
jgi:hypothetical protein